LAQLLLNSLQTPEFGIAMNYVKWFDFLPKRLQLQAELLKFVE